MSAEPPAPARRPRALVVLSAVDPVARAVGERWGLGTSTGEHVDGAPLREIGDDLLVLRRPGAHLHDDHLEQRLPSPLGAGRTTLVFPSIHRSESGARCLTVHPLGNPGPVAELGGRPRSFVPVDARSMTALLRSLTEEAVPLGVPATFEATHHGPELAVPAFFAEVAVAEGTTPLDAEVAALANALRSFRPEPSDRVVLGVGGGHYAPHFTELALRRRWAFAHLLSKHALDALDGPTALAAWEASPGAEGLLFARAQDRDHPAFERLGPTLRENDAPRRVPATEGPTSGSRPASGT